MAYQLKVSLDGSSKPPIWRKLLVPDNFTFMDLHESIQAAMGWENAHLFSFSHPGPFGEGDQIGIPFEDDWMDMEVLDARTIKLREHLHKPKQKMHYEYDFGDGWQHTIMVEDITDDKLLAPQCLKGKGACPPEDCGGIWGYYNLVETVNNPKNPDYEDMREWLGLEKGEKWDVEAFNIEECRWRLSHFRR